MGPLVNAITRIGSVEEKLLLFESMLEYKAYEKIASTKRGCVGQFESRVQQSVRTCKNVKSRQDRARDSLFDTIVKKIDDENLLQNKILAIKVDEDSPMNKNITGLVANKLMSKYQRPVMLLNHNEDVWMGSGRNRPIEELPSLQDFLIKSNLVNFAEGHDNACGISVSENNFEELIQYSNDKLKGVEFIIKHDVDLIYPADSPQINSDIYSLAELKHV